MLNLQTKLAETIGAQQQAKMSRQETVDRINAATDEATAMILEELEPLRQLAPDLVVNIWPTQAVIRCNNGLCHAVVAIEAKSDFRLSATLEKQRGVPVGARFDLDECSDAETLASLILQTAESRLLWWVERLAGQQ